MSAQTLILKHDEWRKGLGGAPAGVAGESDGNAYTGLDLNLITFSTSTFSGSSFAATTFRSASWSGCQFVRCSFSGCDMRQIEISGCTFVGCTFASVELGQCRFSSSSFTDCEWNELNFDDGYWSELKLLSCRGSGITADRLRGAQADFTGSRFQNMRLRHASIN